MVDVSNPAFDLIDNFDPHVDVLDQSGYSNGEEETIPSVLIKMRRVWANEKVSQVLLPHRYELVDCLVTEVDRMNKALIATGVKDLFSGAKKHELARITFVVNSYMRCRLEKIEKNPANNISLHKEYSEKNQIDLMDQRESDLAHRLLESNQVFLHQSFLKHLPSEFSKTVISKDNSYLHRVFIRVGPQLINNVGVYSMSSANEVNFLDLEPDSIHYLPFVSIAKALEEGKADLL